MEWGRAGKATHFQGACNGSGGFADHVSCASHGALLGFCSKELCLCRCHGEECVLLWPPQLRGARQVWALSLAMGMGTTAMGRATATTGKTPKRTNPAAIRSNFVAT